MITTKTPHHAVTVVFWCRYMALKITKSTVVEAVAKVLITASAYLKIEEHVRKRVDTLHSGHHFDLIGTFSLENGRYGDANEGVEHDNKLGRGRIIPLEKKAETGGRE